MPQRSFGERVWNRLCMTKTFRRIATPFAPIPRPKRWIFIIGCYNSGTSLLKSILAEHRAITWLPARGGAYTDELEWPESYGWTRMWHKCYKQLRMEPGPGAEHTARSIKRRWGLVLGRSPQNVLIKSITDAVRLPFLNEYFRPAYFVYIVRNGYAVAEGIKRRADPSKWGCERYSGGYPIELCAAQWKRSDQVVERDRASTEHFLRITYEDLTERTNKTVKTITDFLDIRQVDRRTLNRKWQIHGILSTIQNMNQKSIDNLSKSEIKTINRKAKKILQKYDYYQDI
ncbi:hypothetical protein GGQ20_001838 [Salinibacter ruber]|nr:hypothetical protein [Salinibacter ruber]